MSSKFSELRKKLKKQKENPASTEVVVSDEELNELLSALDDAPTETVVTTKVDETAREETVKVEEVKKELFKATHVFFDSSVRKYKRTVIEYDLDTGYSKIVGVEAWADGQAMAIHKANQEITLRLMQGKERK